MISVFTPIYDRVLNWAAHRHASYYLSGLSFIESFFFPIPPDVMLAPMTLARPNRWFFYAALTTGSSVLGGIAGYVIGYYGFGLVQPWIIEFGYQARFEQAQNWFTQWGFWVVLIAGFSPIPYKVFTIAAGTLSLFLPAFIMASLVGRGLRFFMLSGLIRLGGERMSNKLRSWVEVLGWLTVGILLVSLIWWYQGR